MTVDVSAVAAIRDKIKADRNAEGIADALRELDALCADFDIPELEPFEIVD